MNDNDNNIEKVITALKERAKELNCMYRVEEALQKPDDDLNSVFSKIMEAIPLGVQNSGICQVRIFYNNLECKTPEYIETNNKYISDIKLQDEHVGLMEVSYKCDMPAGDEGPFLKEERQLLDTIANRISQFILHRHMRRMFQDLRIAENQKGKINGRESKLVTDLLMRTDHELYNKIARRMLNYLFRNKVKEAEQLMQRLSSGRIHDSGQDGSGDNIPIKKKLMDDILEHSKQIFDIATRTLSDKEVISNVQKWMQEDKANFLVEALNNPAASLDEIIDRLRRFQQLSTRENLELSENIRRSIKVNLIRRLMNSDLNFIKTVKDYIELDDFFNLLPNLIFPNKSMGRLGGKGTGLFIASQIAKRLSEEHEELMDIKVPKTYYITSDTLHKFLHYNHLEDILEQKYKDISQIRQEYPQIIEIFKNSKFPPEIVQKLALIMDDFVDAPLIVRSSSLLEDQLQTSFSGKYKSFFIANQGSKREKLEALMDAISEVYASTFSPDPIEYRAERDILDAQEEMGVLVQEVVGRKVGPYFLPAFAGVAFSNNEFRWSPRIKREDGLVRIVPGLGTRAVDRLSDDYPILIAPGQPNLRVNVTQDEMIRYSPNKLDVINLKNNSFETIDFVDFIKGYADEFPQIFKLISVIKEGHIQRASLIGTDFDEYQPVVTFDGIINETNFVKQIGKILKVLQEKLGHPVDIEFASNGDDFYLLQCRPQSYGKRCKPALIPKDIPENAIIFSANRYISNGYVPDITHIVYVDPQRYSEIEDKRKMMDVGRAVSGLNMRLPKRQFILMGPGRWGSRGDIKLGVSITYSDINNTAILIEVARKKGNYIPDLSFGTHFFQDLVEAEIRYLPLYPDEEGIIFNDRFLCSSPSILPHILPEFNYLEDIVRVIDIPSVTHGKVLRVLMNADLDEAVGILTQPSARSEEEEEDKTYLGESASSEHWRWRMRMVESIADRLDGARFGVKTFYVFGSTKNGTAGPESDIDILIHFAGNEEQKQKLFDWFEGWSQCLDEINYLRTGYRSGGLLDVHIVTDEDIARKSPFAEKIGAVTDAAREVPLKKAMTI
ncbi:nucleotidyltransferase domain-containing protein [bacterium]|nr:nucleotidyltransferase domain-containing protein [bacterium]